MPEFHRNKIKPRGSFKRVRRATEQTSERTPERTMIKPPKRKYKQNKILYVLPLCVAAVILIGILSTTVLFNAHTIVVSASGEQNPAYSQEEILAAGNIVPGVNLMTFDRTLAQKNIADSLVRLDEVEIHRVFPSTLNITVTNAQRIFSVYSQESDLYYEVSQGRRIMNISNSRPSGLIVTGLELEGLALGGEVVCLSDDASLSAASAEKVRIVFELFDLITQREMSITRIEITRGFEVVLFYGSGSGSARERIEIRMGAPAQLEEKLLIAHTIIEEQIEPNESGILRVTSTQKASFV